MKVGFKSTVQWTSPVEGSAIFSRETSSKEEIDSAISQLQLGQERWSLRSLEERRKILYKSLSEFEAKKEEIAEELTMLIGRPKKHCFNEVDGCIERGNYMLDIAEAALEDWTLNNNKLPLSSQSKLTIRK